MEKRKTSFTRQELYNLVWSKPLTTIAKEYDVPYSILKKTYKENNIPCPNLGYWSKMKFNKKVSKTPLPKSIDSDEISLSDNKDKEIITLKLLSEKQQLKKEIESELKSYLKVSDKLTKPHEYIVEAKRDLKSKKPSSKNNVQGLICTSGGIFNIMVYKENIKRALRFSDAFLKLFIKRGHKVEITNKGTILTIREESYNVCVRELRKRERRSNGYGSDYLPTGILTLRIYKDWVWKMVEWKDSKTSLVENKLSQILINCEIRAKKDKEYRVQFELSRAENERKRKIEEEIQRQKENELENVRALIRKSELWKKADDLRNYIKEVENMAIKNEKLTGELKNWLDWANKKADWYDPLVEKEDDFLFNVDRDKLVFKKSSWW